MAKNKQSNLIASAEHRFHRQVYYKLWNKGGGLFSIR